MIRLIVSLIKTLALIALFSAIITSCTKPWEDITIRYCKNVSLISERYTIDWKYIKTVRRDYGVKCDYDVMNYERLRPDTIVSACSIDKIDSAFRIEIIKYVTY